MIQEVLSGMAADVAAGKMIFPTHVDIALRVQREIDDPECSLEKLGRLISAEPFLSARLISIANSLAYSPTGQPCGNVRSALARLGMGAVRSVTAAVIVRQMQSMINDPAHRALAASLWAHTTQVAALARTIARRVTFRDPEEAFFAGIMHEVGSFYLLARAAEVPELLTSGIVKWYLGGEWLVSHAVVRALDVPADIVAGLECMWDGYLAMPPRSLGDTLLLADRLSPVESPFQRLLDTETTPTVADIELMIGDRLLSQIMAESADEIASLSRALEN